VLLVAASVFVIGVRYGTFAASDTDPYGYVSESELIAHGTLRVDQRFALTLPFRNAPAAFAPAGYKLAPVDGFIVPTYPPGLPLVMAALLRVTGQRGAVYYAVPLFGAVTIWLTALLGTRVYSPLAGVLAAVLVATSPSFLYQVTQPVSDVPAAAWTTLALLLALHERKWARLTSGLAASLAILTRPNLVVLALVIAGLHLWQTAFGSERREERRGAPLLLFIAGLIPGCIALAALNQYLYGSPRGFGYAPFGELYEWSAVLPNLDRYPRWLMQTQTPFVLLGLLAPLFARRHRASLWLLLTFAAALFLSYLPYGVFGREEWIYVRFLLPAYPALIALSVVAGLSLADRLPHRKTTLLYGFVAVVVAVALWQAREAVRRGAFVTYLVEQRYLDVARYVAGLPRDAVVIASLHAGSIRHHAGQLTINYRGLHPRALDDAIAALDARGERVYFVLEAGEEDHFRWQFGTYSNRGRLDWPPAAQTFRGVPIHLYDPRDRERFLAGQPVVTYDIGLVAKPIVRQK